jgi:hypothetical protein
MIPDRGVARRRFRQTAICSIGSGGQVDGARRRVARWLGNGCSLRVTALEGHPCHIPDSSAVQAKALVPRQEWLAAHGAVTNRRKPAGRRSACDDCRPALAKLNLPSAAPVASSTTGTMGETVWDPGSMPADEVMKERPRAILRHGASRVPKVTVAFWVTKALTTGMGGPAWTTSFTVCRLCWQSPSAALR